MCITTSRRATIAALLGFAALAISGTAGAASNSAGAKSAVARSQALACAGMIRSFQSDVVAAATARGAREESKDAEWRGIALKAASSWFRSGCFSITP
jgi:hypothetical protein